jgi:hypothetical protein
MKTTNVETYKDLKRIPPKLAHHKIELDITIPLAH